MNYLDLIILLISAVAFVLGFKDGFVRKLIGSIGFVLAVFLGIKLSGAGGRAVVAITGIEPEFSQVIGGFVLFLTVILIAAVLKRVIHPFDKVNNMINRIVGGVAGVLQILVFLSAAFYLLNVFKIPSETAREKSLFYKPVTKVLPVLISAIRDVTPSVHNPMNAIMRDSLSTTDSTDN